MRETPKKFNIWLLTFCLQTIIILVAGYFGFFKALFIHDVSHVGFITLGLWVFLSLSIGYKNLFGYDIDEWQWFSSELMMGLGLLGTVIGLIITFGAFDSINYQDPETMKTAIRTISTGMSTAFFATICGIVGSYSSKLQLVLAEHDFDSLKSLKAYLNEK